MWGLTENFVGRVKVDTNCTWGKIIQEMHGGKNSMEAKICVFGCNGVKSANNWGLAVLWGQFKHVIIKRGLFFF